MTLEAFILGTGGMMPLPGRHLTSVLLRRAGELFLFDCGEGTQVSLRRLNLRWKKISVIFITHIHADHVTGLPGMLMLSSQVDRDDPLIIVGPPKIGDFVNANRQILEMYINYPIEVVEFSDPGVVYQGDGFRVRAFPLRHTRMCMGYTLEEDRRPGVFFPDKALEQRVPRGPQWSQLQGGDAVTLDDGTVVQPQHVMGPSRSGRKFSFVTDTLPTPHIADAVRGSDLFICEGMFTEDLMESALEKRHLTAKQAAAIARDAEVKRLGLIHYSPRYTKGELKQLEEEALSVFPNSFLTVDRQTIDIPYED